jgi:hypothetical protein
MRAMRTVTQLAPVAVCLVLATSAFADHFSPLSPNHTRYGVSQLQFGDVAGREQFDPVRPVIRLNNPNHVTQAVAILAYQAERGPRPGRAEVFDGCHVEVLTPNASQAVSGAEFPNGAVISTPQYAEAIWAPLDPVRLRDDDDDDDDDDDGNGRGPQGGNRRIADGLGGLADFSGVGGDLTGSTQNLAHPGLFSLPSDAVVPGQRQAAITCVCTFVKVLSLSRDIFNEFGISCP